jgi:hypothetical protein
MDPNVLIMKPQGYELVLAALRADVRTIDCEIRPKPRGVKT